MLIQALAIKHFCYHLTNPLEPEWIPRGLNEVADYISRIVDYDYWILNPDVFVQLDKIWGPHTVDRYANFNNKQLYISTSGFGTQKQRLWTLLLLLIGKTKTIGGVHPWY